MRIELTEDQWRRFSRDYMDDPKESALQKCCGNISALRDVIMKIHARGGDVDAALHADLSQKWDWVRRGHTLDEVKFPSWLTLKSLIEQAGLPWRFA